MPHALSFLLLILSTNYVCCSLRFTRTGEKVILQSHCQYCEDQGLWVRINCNESLQKINTKCEQSPCRFFSKQLNHTHVSLTIDQVEPGDTGRYYCGEFNGTCLQFSDNGTVLLVGDIWTHSSAIHLLNKWMGEGGSKELDWNKTSNGRRQDKDKTDSNSDRSEVPQHTELRCVVTGLSASWVNIIWRSSQKSWEKPGQTWSFTYTGRGVESRLRIGLKVKSDWEYESENETSYRVQQLNLDRVVDMDEELWCEVQVGVNSIVQSTKFSFLQQTHTDPEWCNKLLYGEIALCTLCVCLLTLLLCHCLQHKHKGSEPSLTEVSPTCRDITYAELDIKRKPRTERKQRQAQNQQEDSMVYSQVRCKHD